MDIYLIKDLACISGFSIYTIKYYLKIGLIKESGRFPETNFRYFNNTTMESLKNIHELRKKKKSIRQIKQILDIGA
ncbi:MAG: MerR family transcriptional regulator [Candidatus Omnitrophota bacterium]